MTWRVACSHGMSWPSRQMTLVRPFEGSVTGASGVEVAVKLARPGGAGLSRRRRVRGGPGAQATGGGADARVGGRVGPERAAGAGHLAALHHGQQGRAAG